MMTYEEKSFNWLSMPVAKKCRECGTEYKMYHVIDDNEQVGHYLMCPKCKAKRRYAGIKE